MQYILRLGQPGSNQGTRSLNKFIFQKSGSTHLIITPFYIARFIASLLATSLAKVCFQGAAWGIASVFPGRKEANAVFLKYFFLMLIIDAVPHYIARQTALFAADDNLSNLR